MQEESDKYEVIYRMKKFQDMRTRFKRMIKYLKWRSFCDYINAEDWRILPSSYYWKYSEETIREMEKEELKKLRCMVQDL